MLNDSYQVNVCLQYPGHTLALASLHVASALAECNIISWFAEQPTSDHDNVTDAIQQILTLYATDHVSEAIVNACLSTVSLASEGLDRACEERSNKVSKEASNTDCEEGSNTD